MFDINFDMSKFLNSKKLLPYLPWL